MVLSSLKWFSVKKEMSKFQKTQNKGYCADFYGLVSWRRLMNLSSAIRKGFGIWLSSLVRDCVLGSFELLFVLSITLRVVFCLYQTKNKIKLASQIIYTRIILSLTFHKYNVISLVEKIYYCNIFSKKVFTLITYFRLV